MEAEDYIHLLHVDGDTSEDSFQQYARVMRCGVAPFFGLVGVLGNTLNICVLGWRCYQGKMDMLERGAMYGLISLATSDLVFCLSIIPYAFFLQNRMRYERCFFQCLFQMYGLYLHDLSVKISTWVTVLIAMARYVVVCHPLRARLMVGTLSMKVCLLLIHIFWVLFLLPILWTYKSLSIDELNLENMTMLFVENFTTTSDNGSITKKETISSEGSIYIDTGEFSENEFLRQGFLYSWATLGYFIPLIILTFSNVCLIRALRNSATVRERHLTVGNDSRHVHMRQANTTITRTLILLIVFFIILVSPSQIVGFYNSVSGDRSLNQLHRIEFLLMLSNVLVTANFASHFFLYCTVSSSFRRTLMSMLRSIMGRVLSLRVYCPKSSGEGFGCRRSLENDENIKLKRVNLKQISCTYEANSSRQKNASEPKESLLSNLKVTPHLPKRQTSGSELRRNSITVTSIVVTNDSRPASIIVE